MIWLLIPLALAFLGWLIWPGAGVGVRGLSIHPSFRVRFGSLLPRLLGSDACAVFGVVHVAAKQVSTYLLAHEIGHVRRANGDHLAYLWRYLTSSLFRETEEAACEAFGREHAGDSELRMLLVRMNRLAA